MENNFIPARRKLWDELTALSAVDVKTEGQRVDECIKSRMFLDWEPVEDQLKHPFMPWMADGLTDIQCRILQAVRTNSAV